MRTRVFLTRPPGCQIRRSRRDPCRMPISAPAFTITDPDVCGPLAVFPILGPQAGLEFRSYAEAAALGVELSELPEGASVTELMAVNPLETPVLLYEGEEVHGAQQDRTLDRSILVGAGSKVRIPVTCVEHGRWDGSRHAEAFTPAPQASHPSLRRMKSRASAESGAAASVQGEVWQEVARVSVHHGATGETGALRDAFAASSSSLTELQAAVRRRDGQLGAVCCFGGQVQVVDLVGRADVYAALHAPLLAGYALDALERGPDSRTPAADEVQRFLDVALGASRRSRPAIGLGEEAVFTTAISSGAVLEQEGELVALTAFGSPMVQSSIRRPSRRRR